MATVYENKVKGIGDAVKEFESEGLFISFGDIAPDALKDYCYIIDINPINGDIVVGQKLILDGKEYKITAVGNEVKQHLEELGHITYSFSGATEAELPGTLYVEEAPVPTLSIGSTLVIAD